MQSVMVQKCIYQIVDLGREENLKALIEWWEFYFLFFGNLYGMKLLVVINAKN